MRALKFSTEAHPRQMIIVAAVLCAGLFVCLICPICRWSMSTIFVGHVDRNK